MSNKTTNSLVSILENSDSKIRSYIFILYFIQDAKHKNKRSLDIGQW